MTSGQRATFYSLVAVGLVLTFAFAVAWFSPQSIPNNFHGVTHATDFFLFAVLSYVVWHQIGTELLLWLIAEKIRKPRFVRPEEGLRVAFITTFVPGSEPIELLHRILPALVRVDYPHESWLLDEGNSREARALCHQYGVRYFTRHELKHYNTDGGRFAARTKGGNHNAWYDAHGYNYDIVAQIDTDFVPRKDFLMRTLGFFRDSDVAFVGTPQIYGNTRRSYIAKGAAEQLYTFYGPILRGLYGRDIMMMLGANHVVRVDALRDIDFYTAHITEDLITGMTLHSYRWKSVYVPMVLAAGEGPETWVAYFNQQMRWAYGCFDILFHYSFSRLKRMQWEQKRYYLMMLQHYFSGVAMAAGVFILVLNFIFGIAASSMNARALLIYVPMIVWQLVISLWLQRFNISPTKETGLLLAGRIISIASWPIFFMAFIGVLRGKRLSFKVTPKGKDQSANVPMQIFLPHLVIATVTLLAFLASFATHDQTPVIDFWACVTIITMFGIPLGAWVLGRKSAKQALRSLGKTKRTRPQVETIFGYKVGIRSGSSE